MYIQVKSQGLKGEGKGEAENMTAIQKGKQACKAFCVYVPTTGSLGTNHGLKKRSLTGRNTIQIK